MSRFARRRAFTLIELLVVIAIIAVLAAIILPVFAGVREKARQITCLSNQKQLGLAVMQYSQDFDEAIVPGALNHPEASSVDAFGNTGADYSWKALIYPYVKSAAVYRCPSNPYSDPTNVNNLQQYMSVTAPGVPAAVNVFSYAINTRVCACVGDGQNNHCGPGTVFLASVNAPSSKIIITEGLNNFGDVASAWWADPGNQWMWTAGFFAGHQDSLNVIFLDGHARSYKPTNLMRNINMFGGFDDNTQTGQYGPECNGGGNVNCDQPSPAALQGLGQVEQAFH